MCRNKIAFIILLVPAFLFLQGCQDNIILPDTTPTLQAPRLLYPPNDTTEVDIPVTFSWGNSRGAESYSLQVSTDSFFNNTIYDSSGITRTSQLVERMSKFTTTFYWRVNAINKYKISEWSKVWNFTIDQPIHAPLNLNPPDSTIIQPANIVLSWTYGDFSPVDRTYDVYLGIEYPIYTRVSANQIDTFLVVDKLSQGITYYWKVAAVSKQGHGVVSSTLRFTTLFMTCKDIPSINYEGKTYNTIQIGNQCWLRENLDVGTMILTDSNLSDNGIIEKYCYGDDTTNCYIYGGLYQWNEAMQYTITEGSQGICPSGWHIPTHSEFENLSNAVSGDGNALKAVGQGSGDGAGTNTSGFSALLSGYRWYGFEDLGNDTGFWSSTGGSTNFAWTMYFRYNMGLVVIGKALGFSIRCLKD